MPSSKPTLFVGSSTESLPVANVLQTQLQHDAVVNVWNQGIFGLSDYTLDRLLRATKEFDFAAFILGADDTVESRGKRYLVARDNVVLEIGIFAGAIGRGRTFIILQGTKEPVHFPSDLQGITPAVFHWDQGVPFADLTRLNAAIGPCSQSLRIAMNAQGTESSNLKPLSAGMVFLALWMRDRGYSLHELEAPFRRFQTETSRLGPGKETSAYAAKAAKYGCQCLEALGLVESFGGNEYALTPLGTNLLDSHRIRRRFSNTYDVYERLKST